MAAKKLFRPVIILLGFTLAIFIVGCGAKGDLVLPDAEQQQQTQQQSQQQEEQPQQQSQKSQSEPYYKY